MIGKLLILLSLKIKLVFTNSVAANTSHSYYKDQPVTAVYGNSCYLFSELYNTNAFTGQNVELFEFQACGTCNFSALGG
jgi:hypothetical protein